MKKFIILWFSSVMMYGCASDSTLTKESEGESSLRVSKPPRAVAVNVSSTKYCQTRQEYAFAAARDRDNGTTKEYRIQKLLNDSRLKENDWRRTAMYNAVITAHNFKELKPRTISALETHRCYRTLKDKRDISNQGVLTLESALKTCETLHTQNAEMFKCVADVVYSYEDDINNASSVIVQ